MPRPTTHKIPNVTVHNLSSRSLNTEQLTLLTKGLSFAPTPNIDNTVQYPQLLRQYNEFARSLRPIYTHAVTKPNITPTKKEQPEQSLTDRPYIYRQMKFLPKLNHITYTQD